MRNAASVSQLLQESCVPRGARIDARGVDAGGGVHARIQKDNAEYGLSAVGIALANCVTRSSSWKIKRSLAPRCKPTPQHALRSRQQPRFGDRGDPVVYMEHVEDRRDVTLDGAFGDVELPRDHLVRQALRQQREHFLLARTQQFQTAGIGRWRWRRRACTATRQRWRATQTDRACPSVAAADIARRRVRAGWPAA